MKALTLPRRKRSAKAFAAHCAAQAKYWAALPDRTPMEIAEGVAFSILAALDGESMAVPAFAVRPLNEIGGEGRDISGSLHELFIKAANAGAGQ